MADFIEQYDTDEWEVETPTGWQSFSGIGKTIEYDEWEVITESDRLICADDHLLFNEDDTPVQVKSLSVGDKIQSRLGLEKIKSVNRLDSSSNMYDLLDVEGGNKFYTNGILSHNSTTIISYLLHYILFNPEVNVAILANKGAVARELLSRLQLAYEHLPKFLQQGVTVWNKGNIELENGSKMLASATSGSAVRGSSFNCISGSSTILLKDNFNNTTTKVSIADFYSNSSREMNTYKYEYGDDKQQIQEMVLFSDEESTLSNIRQRARIGKTPHNTKIPKWWKPNNQYSEIDNQRAFDSTPSTSKISIGNTQSKNVVRVFYDVSGQTGYVGESHGTSTAAVNSGIFPSSENYTNRVETFRRNKKKDWKLSHRKNCNKGTEIEAVKSHEGKTVGCEEAFGLWRKNIQSFDGNEKNHRTCGENKQKSRKNTQDGRKTSWYETIRRGEKTNERVGQKTDQNSGWAMEQGNEVGRWEVYTSGGWKKFYGISKSVNQKTLQIRTDKNSIKCTPDHKISTKDGFIQAKDITLKSKIRTLDNQFCDVVEVKNANNCDVYDLLHVEDVHSFYANDLEVSNCIFLDEFAHVPNTIAESFFTSVYPTISSGETTKVFIVSTPLGMNLFYKMWIDAEEKRNNYIPIEVHYTQVPGRDEKWRQETIKNTSEVQFNQEFLCEFLGSTHTLIDASKLRSMVFKKPIFSKNNIDVYEEPIKKATYCMIVDTAQGKGQDFSAFSVFDVSQIPYRQVVKYRDNNISPMLYPNVIYQVGMKYNTAFILLEINDMGAQVAETLHYDLEYENVMITSMKGRAGQQIGGGFSKNIQLGIRTSKQLKRIGCATLKEMIETDKLIVPDFETIAELTTFASKHNSFEAEEGSHDDLAMTLVIFAWLVQQRYFKDITNLDLRQKMYEEFEEQFEQDMLPFGIIDDGREEDTYTDNTGQRWEVSPSERTYF